MAVKHTIQATIIDITVDHPKATDTFLVDTNVWFWMTYLKVIKPTHQSLCYPPYLDKAMAVSAQIHYSGLTLAELAHSIEKTEREIFDRAKAKKHETKEYRHNFPSERAKVVAEFHAAWSQVKSQATLLPLTIDDPTTDSALKRFQKERVDGYDLFLLETMKKHGIAKIITDDGDFAMVPNIQVFTANRGVLHVAKKQQKLLKR